MNKKKLKCDFHTHPLSHRYYPMECIYSAKKNENGMVILSDEDKKRIEEFVHYCIDERELDVVAITDHDLAESSIYAREYVKENNLPIKIIIGAECEIILLDSFADGYVHLLVLGLEDIPEHPRYMTIEEMQKFVDDIQRKNGYVIMAHPKYSEFIFYNLCEYLDGYEELNRDTISFEIDKNKARDRKNLEHLRAFKNSDIHFFGEGHTPLPTYYNELDEDDEMLRNLLY